MAYQQKPAKDAPKPPARARKPKPDTQRLNRELGFTVCPSDERRIRALARRSPAGKIATFLRELVLEGVAMREQRAA